MNAGSRAVLLADDVVFTEHVAPPDHPERAERLLAVRQGLELAASTSDGAYTRLSPTDATDEQLERVHQPEYLTKLGHLAGRSGYLDSDTFVSPRTIEAARRAAGSAVGLVDALDRNAARVGIAIPRPPGHHALSDRAMGFCLLNNVAVAAAHARARGHERVLIVDWDVHHGNGTEAMFYEDPSVLFVSLHQFPNYPGTGAASDKGRGDGRGRNVNLPLPAGATDAVYRAAFERIVLPIVEQFAPTLALVSCGFDAHERDPLANMRLSAAGYAYMTEQLLAVLDERCPLGVVLEGGYDLQALRESSQAVAGVLLGAPATPGEDSGRLHDAGRLHEEQEEALAQVRERQLEYWKLP